MLDEGFFKCSPILHYGRDSLSSVFMYPLQDSIKWYLLRWIILNLHFIFFSWYIWWLGDKHECSLKLLFQATLAICSTLHLTILHINPRREHWSSCSPLVFNTWTQSFPMDKFYKNISMQTLVHKDCHKLPKPQLGQHMPLHICIQRL